MTTGYEVRETPNFIDDRGSLAFVECGQALDFVVKRVYWLYNIKKDRGGHAHKELKQFVFCVHGSVDFVVDDGTTRTSVTLDSPNKGCIFTNLYGGKYAIFKTIHAS